MICLLTFIVCLFMAITPAMTAVAWGPISQWQASRPMDHVPIDVRRKNTTDEACLQMVTTGSDK